MFKTLKRGFKRFERGEVGQFGNDVSTPRTRRLAMWHFHLFDHAFLRGIWTNLYEIAPCVWRSNQPSPARIKRYARMGIKTILSLRGDKDLSFMLLEKQACAEHGITLITTNKAAARGALSGKDYVELIDLLASIPKPFLIHCKSGADRAGLASALYLLHCEGASIKEAKKMLSLRFMHLKSTKTGILDHILDLYEADLKADGPIPIRDWFETRYDIEKARTFKTMRSFP
ncbi:MULTISPECIES: tyrosine-protein phosphatase [Roseobacteraceae]|uniref:Protein tyrosine/serine phosphatase n=1 Tax=Celeribacter baekdonensis B30 TaxID=1208323 RepID=K2JED0_9RHOB|nr:MULTISPECIES: tyrosine-protein phosphatase [Roseobacteraceae]EKE73468.1 protein tyrosine/serine phosphatase [Celeribacter baekdonensis B30]KAB6717537.1 protein tyrosine phosphatase [Roseobacter sp. TSBP12]|tara:strand:+ start:15028 stop:15717 length:690 start_codon:yes stop_codon:yes gene_type:complete